MTRNMKKQGLQFVFFLYLGLFVHVPGEGDGVVGDFFDVANGVEALLVIRCEDRQGWFIYANPPQTKCNSSNKKKACSKAVPA